MSRLLVLLAVLALTGALAGGVAAQSEPAAAAADDRQPAERSDGAGPGLRLPGTSGRAGAPATRSADEDGGGPDVPGVRRPTRDPRPGSPDPAAGGRGAIRDDGGARGDAAAPGQVQELDRIVAVVNREVITRLQLDERVAIAMRSLRSQNVQLPPREVIEKQVLERLILDRAQAQYAEESGIKIDDLQVDRALERIAEQNRMSMAQFRQTLEHDGVSFDKVREDIRMEITLARLREREVDNKLQVTDSEVDNYLAEGAARSAPAGVDTEYRVEHVLVQIPEGATAEQLAARRRRAEEALEQTKSGTDFGKVAVTFSDAPDALQGGAMGWRGRDRLPELFVAALDRMKPGEVSTILRSPAGFHILRLLEVRGSKIEETEVEQFHARHIVIRSNELVSEDDARKRIVQLHDRIAQGEDFAELAKLNSDDGSAARGGDLGWLYPGDTVPDFERLVARLEPGQLSQPFRTQFGWHVVQLLERRRGDVSSDRRRMEARKAVLGRKSEEAYDNWLRELRDRTYTELRLEDR